MMVVGRGEAHAKVILIGEHSVVYHQPAIALPLNHVRITATVEDIEESPDRSLNSTYYTGPLIGMPKKFAGVRALVDQLLARFYDADNGFRLTLTSDIPIERGMGSSAAVAGAITRAIFDHAGATLTNEQLLAAIDIEEVITHGSASGIDAAAVSGTRPVWFVKGRARKYFSTNASGCLVIADSGVRGRTGKAVKSVRTMLADPQRGAIAQHAIDHLGELAYTATVSMQHDEMGELGTTMNKAQAELTTLGVSHPTLDRLIDAARQAGALGAKLTGGGQGGCVIALTATQEEATVVAQALRGAGATGTWIEPMMAL